MNYDKHEKLSELFNIFQSFRQVCSTFSIAWKLFIQNKSVKRKVLNVSKSNQSSFIMEFGKFQNKLRVFFSNISRAFTYFVKKSTDQNFWKCLQISRCSQKTFFNFLFELYLYNSCWVFSNKLLLRLKLLTTINRRSLWTALQSYFPIFPPP